MLKSKKCSACGETKEVIAFVKNCSSPDGYYSQCKLCRKEYYQKNKEKILEQRKVCYQNNRVDKIKATADYRRRRLELQPDYRAVENRAAFARKIGISPDIVEEHYKKQFMRQQATCPACGKITEELCIDHNHRKQGVESLRGLLCGDCNVAISWFNDNPNTCENASTYLRKYS